MLPSSKPKIVKEFPERALLTTGPGSFVIAAHIGLPHNEDTLFSVDTPFERRAMLRLRLAMLGTQAAADEAAELAELTPFAARAQDGISKTLCRALARFGGAGHDQPFEVRFAWASAAPTDLPDHARRLRPRAARPRPGPRGAHGRHPHPDRPPYRARAHRILPGHLTTPLRGI